MLSSRNPLAFFMEYGYSGGHIVCMSKSKFSDNLVRLKCTECSRTNYFTRRNKKTTEKLELKKYCKWEKKHTVHKEVKK